MRIALYREGGLWFAHSLDFDLIGDGESIEDALGMLATAIDIQIAESVRYNNPANLLNPVPDPEVTP